MVINFTPEEYQKLCRIADHYGTKPAWLAYSWIVSTLAVEDWILRHGVREKMGVGDGMGASHDDTPIPSHPDNQEPA